jgi:TonB-dependent receptor
LSKYLYANTMHDYFGSIDGDVRYKNFVFADIAALKAASNFDTLARNPPRATPANQAITQGAVAEKYTAGYLMISGKLDVFGRDLKFNGGGRYVHTDQQVSGPVLINGNLLSLTTERGYNDFLPSANAVYKLRDDVTLRAAASRTISRPNPNDLLPGVSFIDPSAQTANAGNPNLQPFTSDNLDVGGEWYTGGLGYVGISIFHKTAKNFTSATQVAKTFDQLGIPFTSITALQQAAITAAGGPSVAKVSVNTQTNSDSPLKFNGVEATWVQPLDFVLDGLGYSTVFTHITTSGKANLATGVPKNAFNFTGYYEHGPFSIHASYAYADRRSYLPAPQNGLPLGIYIEPRDQFDLSASYDMGLFGGDNKLTFNVVNLTNAPIKQTFGYKNATYSIYSAGAQFSLGVQAKF